MAEYANKAGRDDFLLLVGQSAIRSREDGAPAGSQPPIFQRGGLCFLLPRCVISYLVPQPETLVHGISHHHVRLPDRRDVRTVGFDDYKENVGG